MKLINILLLFLVFIVGCASPIKKNTVRPQNLSLSGNIYNMKTAEVINAVVTNNGSGYGKVVATRPNGQKLYGHYATIQEGNSNYNSIRVKTNNYKWATLRGFSFNQPNKQYGSATIAGNGLVIDIVYATSRKNHGYGVGKDNKGGRYKVQF